MASCLAAEDDVGWDGQEDDPAVAALVGLASAVEYGDSDDGEGAEEAVDEGVEPAGAGAGAPLAPPALGAGVGEHLGGIGDVGGGGGGLGHAPPPPGGVPPASAHPLGGSAAAGPDPFEGWHNASEDSNEGRLPKRDKPSHRFKTRNLNKTTMPKVMEGSEFAVFRKLWDEDIMNLAVTNTNLRLAKLRAKDPKPVKHHVDITERELWLWQGLTMVMGICRLPSVELYWSKKHFGGLAVACFQHKPAGAPCCPLSAPLLPPPQTSDLLLQLHGGWDDPGALRHHQVPTSVRARQGGDGRREGITGV